MIAPYFIPRRRVGALRPFKFCIHLKEQGWEPYLIVIKSETGELTTHERELLRGIHVYEIETPLDRTHKSGEQLKKQSNSKNGLSVTEKLSRFIDRNYPIDTWLPFFFLKYRSIKKIYEQISPDLVFSTGDPWSAHWLGYKLRKKYKMPWVADFRDPWTLSKVNLKERTWFSSTIDKWWEKRILKIASWLTFTSNKTKELYQKEYSDIISNSSCIYNSYDPALYNSMGSNELPVIFSNNHLNLIFWGRFRKLSPIKSIVDILVEVKKAAPEQFKDIKIHCFGSISNEDEKKVNEEDVLDNFVIHEPVPPEHALNILNKSDILLLSTDLERKDIIPAKLWDYLASKPPILSIAPNSEINKILSETKSGTQLDIVEEKEEIVQLLLSSLNAKLKGEKLPLKREDEKNVIAKFDAVNATQQLTTIFEQLV